MNRLVICLVGLILATGCARLHGVLTVRDVNGRELHVDREDFAAVFYIHRPEKSGATVIEHVEVLFSLKVLGKIDRLDWREPPAVDFRGRGDAPHALERKRDATLRIATPDTALLRRRLEACGLEGKLVEAPGTRVIHTPLRGR